MHGKSYLDLPPAIDYATIGMTDADAYAQPAGRSVDIVCLLLTHWLKLAVGCGIGLAVGVGFYLFSGHRYNASTRILVSKLAGAPLQEGVEQTYGDRAEHVQLIKSDVIVRRAIEDGNLAQLPSLAGSDEPIRDVIDALKVKRSAGHDRSFLNVFDISFQSPFKQDAAAVVEAVVDAYDAYLAETREEQSQELLDLIRQAEGKLKHEIEQLKQQYREFRKAAPIVFHHPVGQPHAVSGETITPPNHYLAVVDQLYKDQRENRQRRTTVQAQIDVLKAMQQEGESRKTIEQYVLMAMAQRSAEGGVSVGAVNPLLGVNPAKERLDAKLLEAHIREANLVYHLGAQHPEVEKVRKTIFGIREAYAAEGLHPPVFDGIVDAASEARTARDGADLAAVYRKFLEEQLRQLDLSDRSIALQLADAIAQAKEYAEFEVIDKQLSHELESKQSLWDGIVQKLNMVDFAKEQTGYRMTRISDVVVELAFKRVLKIVGAFGMLGGLCVFGLQCYREWRDTTLRSLEEVRRFADASVMGVVPRFAVDAHVPPPGAVSSDLRYVHQPGSAEAEAYRSLRTTLFCSTAGDDNRVIQVSSAEPREGKTVSACNLGIAVAQSGKRVLLIDADLRRPAVHQLFNLSQDVGLSDVLRREVEWINAVRATEIEGFFVLTSGSPPQNPAELLTTGGLPSILEAARQEFDYVILDTPPLLAVSDPCIIASHVDGLLLVVRMQQSQRPAVMRVKDMLKSHGIDLLGIIANDIAANSTIGEAFATYAGYYDTGSVHDRCAHTAPRHAQPVVSSDSGGQAPT